MKGRTTSETRPPVASAASTAGLGGTLAFGFGAHLIIAALGVIVAPVFLVLMGPEAYGLITFYLVLQAWMLLFDLGLSPTVARQLSRFTAGALDAGDARALFAAGESFFIASGLAAAIVFTLAAPWLATHWLGRSHIAPGTAILCLRLMGVLLVFRWLTGFYQAALVGLERQNLMNAVAVAGAAARYGGVVAALIFVSNSPLAFFIIQAAGAVAEAVVNRILVGRSLPRAAATAVGGWRRMAGEMRFAGAMVVSSAAGTLINQVDKLALSHALSLSEFGLFGLVVTVTAGIAMVVPPFVQAFQPRLTTLLAQNRRAEFAHVYRLSVELALALAVALAGTIAALPALVMFAWTGDLALGVHLAPVLRLYAAGSGIAALLFTPFLLQYAQGRVRLQVIGSLAFGAVWIPAAVWAAFTWGAIGTGTVWLIGNLAYLALWVPVIHRRLLSPDERRGILAGVWLRGGALALLLAAVSLFPLGSVGRIEAFAVLGAVSLGALILGVVGAPELRRRAVSVLTGRAGGERPV